MRDIPNKDNILILLCVYHTHVEQTEKLHSTSFVIFLELLNFSALRVGSPMFHAVFNYNMWQE